MCLRNLSDSPVVEGRILESVCEVKFPGLPSSSGVRVIAVLVFIVLLVAMRSIVGYPILCKLKKALSSDQCRRDGLYILTPKQSRVPLYFPMAAKSPEQVDESFRIVYSSMVPAFLIRISPKWPSNPHGQVLRRVY